jgi:hypothetical protein
MALAPDVLRAICAGVVVIVAGARPCRAVDYQPFDWVPAPPGAGILMGYYQFTTNRELTNTITGAVKDSHLDSHIGIARYLYYNGSVQAGFWSAPADCKGPLRGHP